MGKTIIVSNRLPVSVKKVDDKLEYYPSVGGLATGLSSYTQSGSGLWIGWPGIPSEDLTEKEKREITRELKKHRCFPVFLGKDLLNDFYNGYSNDVLWPLLHTLPVDRKESDKIWRAYKQANALFAEATLEHSKPGSTIWVHDYQLFLVPELLRIQRPKDRIGFFLHIPFPEAKVLETSKHAGRILRGVLGADLVGLHTASYTENFLDSCRKLHVGEVGPKQVSLSYRTVRVADFPMGIDYNKFSSATKGRAVSTEYQKLLWKYRGKKVILAIDRLDPTKGLAERLKAYQTLLKENPSLHSKVVFVILAVPSRTEIKAYIRLRERVEKLVETINRTYGKRSWEPVEYMFQTLPFAEISALYRRADVAFIAPIRDGMNLVAKEYLASKPKHDGILVLSETAGAAQELKDAIMVNPRKPRTLVKGLTDALTMPPKELKRRVRSMQKHLEVHTVENWADTFMNTLKKPVPVPLPNIASSLRGSSLQNLLEDYRNAHRRLIILDYDGVLQAFARRPHEAKPSPETLDLLRKLTSDPTNNVIIISGRDRIDMTEWFGKLPITLAAEHGALFRKNGQKKWIKTTYSDKEWRKKVDALFRYFALETPGAFIEQKEWCIAWHYRGASPFYAQKNLVGIRRLLKPIVARYGLTVREGHKVLEVIPGDVSKGTIVREWLIHNHDFVLCIGDDQTDEAMFREVPPGSYSVKVGPGLTSATYRLPSVPSVHKLLNQLND